MEEKVEMSKIKDCSNDNVRYKNNEVSNIQIVNQFNPLSLVNQIQCFKLVDY